MRGLVEFFKEVFSFKDWVLSLIGLACITLAVVFFVTLFYLLSRIMMGGGR